METNMEQTINLDPQNWEELRSLAYQMVDDMVDYMSKIEEKPVWKPLEEETIRFLNQPLPKLPQGESQTYQDFKKHVLNNPLGNNHPRFWGWVMGNGIPYAAFVDMLASMMNPNMGGGNHIPNYVERQVLDWCKQMVGFPPEASGILVSGGSMANLIGLAVARNVKAGYDIRKKGLASSTQPLTVYASIETHSSNYKAIELLGIGKGWMRFIPVDSYYRMNLQALEKAITDDKAAGYQPICIIGNAATTNTGAFDDLEALADIAERENLWFHVDGAFGALAKLSPKYGAITAGMERADSLAFDLHKWMYMPIDVGCVLIKNFDHHIQTFNVSPDYLSHMPSGPAGGDQAWFGDLGMELTRSFRALKVWMAIKAYGMDHFAMQIEQDIDHAKYLAKLIEATPQLELLDHVPLNIVCFRFKHPSLSDEELNHLNQEILMQLHERGLAVPSYTRLNGKFALRVSITNHRSRPVDFEFLVEKVLEIANQILTA